jgi:hypothetical protein
MTAGAFDIPIHTKNISTRDFAVRTERSERMDHPQHPQQHQKERQTIQPPMLGAAALLAACATVWFALQESLADGMRLAPCMHFYVSALLPLLLYDHILAPARSKNMWALLAVHAGVMLFAFPFARASVSARLHVLVLGLCLVLAHRQAHRGWRFLLALAAAANSAASVYALAHFPAAAFLYYHVSFALVFAALVLMLYAH